MLLAFSNLIMADLARDSVLDGYFSRMVSTDLREWPVIEAISGMLQPGLG